jgi:uncharacterized protein YchJ
LGDRARNCCPPGSPHSWPVCCNEFSSSQWPASCAGGHNSVYYVVGRLNFLHDQLWVIQCWGCPKQHAIGQSSLLNTRLAGMKPNAMTFHRRSSATLM